MTLPRCVRLLPSGDQRDAHCAWFALLKKQHPRWNVPEGASSRLRIRNTSRCSGNKTDAERGAGRAKRSPCVPAAVLDWQAVAAHGGPIGSRSASGCTFPRRIEPDSSPTGISGWSGIGDCLGTGCDFTPSCLPRLQDPGACRHARSALAQRPVLRAERCVNTSSSSSSASMRVGAQRARRYSLQALMGSEEARSTRAAAG